MSMGWRYLDTGKRSAAVNMELDAALLLDLKDEREAVLHLYDWEVESATYGHFIDPVNYLNLEGIKRHKLDLAKRPTGGGIVFHNCDLAFSVLVPATSSWFSTNPLDNYEFVNSRVIWAIGQMLGTSAALLAEEVDPLDECCRNFCMAKPTKYDVMIGGKKVGGAAQRKTRYGFLHQGSIAIGLLPDAYLEEILAGGTQVLEAMHRNSFTLLGTGWKQKELKEARDQLRALLQMAFSDTYMSEA
jgi:lipoate---protein ligase